MDVEIRPEPEPEERRAIELALERLLAGPGVPPAYTSGWREAGITENVEFRRSPYATARPRSSPGATRA